MIFVSDDAHYPRVAQHQDLGAERQALEEWSVAARAELTEHAFEVLRINPGVRAENTKAPVAPAT